jgi:pyruvate formate lyase activating enzyme
MRLGGLQKNSLIDYPGKISCVIFLSGCNFNCPYCHNPELAKGCPDCPSWLEDRTLFDFLEGRKGLLDGVVISGGEPTLQEDLIPLCERLKQMDYPVKLDTNGSRPKTIKRLIDEGLVDYIAMDVKTDPLHYSPFIKKDCNPVNLLLSIQIIMESALPYEFRTTCVKPIVNEQAIENIGKIIKGARLYALQAFHDTGVLQPEFFSDNEACYDQGELMHLKSIADTWVRECIIR